MASNAPEIRDYSRVKLAELDAVCNHWLPVIQTVMPAQAGIPFVDFMDSRVRGNDGASLFLVIPDGP
ncbi:MAG: hypothetical protein CVU17_11475 [Betaproteobacteria bacterium HGW-Betaproteobacteria-11]|nr:MAG: hypothetical protein CVU17_11475 [Betaproteobacteria bacterium HGW-Betaproteobacteria-11]